MNTTQPAGFALALLSLAALSLTTRSAQAQTAYATNPSGLYSINLTTGAATLIGNSGHDLEGLAISPTGSLFGTSTAGNLYSVSATTGAATLIGSTGLQDPEGLDFFGNTLVCTNFANPTTFFSLDTATATATALVTASTGYIRGMDSTSSTTALVLSDSPTFQSLQSVDLTSGAVTQISTLPGIPGRVVFTGLDYAPNGNLYGVVAAGDVDLINPLTGGVTRLANDGLTFLDFKIASAPVPEASSVVSFGLLLALGGGGLVIAGRRGAGSRRRH